MSIRKHKAQEVAKLQREQIEVIEGIIGGITYHNEETGFTVMELEVGTDYIPVVGELLQVTEGEEIKCTGYFTSHPTYGQQFKATLIERVLPSTSSAILRYLAGGALKGVGPVIAKRLVMHFGDSTLEVIEREPYRMTEVKGITESKAQKIAEEYKKIFGLRSVMLFLSRYGINTVTTVSIWKKWGALAQDIITRNPYCLCDDDIGVQFAQADEIASQLGFGQEDGCRVAGGVLYVLRHNLNNGHSCLPFDKLIDTAAGFLNVEKPVVEEALQRLRDNEDLACDTFEGTSYVYLPHQYTAETYSAGRVRIMLELSYGERPVDDVEIDALEEQLGIVYAADQRKALREAADHSLMILTGGPGTGKTTTLNGIITLFERRGMKVGLSAPTGRAAKRLAELTGREAKTIHRLLEVDFGEDMGYPRFKRNEKNPLPFDAVVVDEMSMVDIRLFESLLRAVKLGAKLIMVGDPDQLPSVGAGNVLKDLISSERVPTVHLSQIFRQAAESLIIVNAHQIVSGRMPDLDIKDSDFFYMNRQSNPDAVATITELCAQRLPRAYGYSSVKDIQVLSPSRQGGAGTIELNKSLQQALNPASSTKVEITRFNQTYREGDKVMQVRNNYDIVWSQDGGEEGLGIFNGDIGIIELIDKPSTSVLIRFDDRVAQYTFDMLSEIDLAYAITVHKSQGNEFDAVIIPVLGSHRRLHYRNLLYTAVTRAKKTLILVGHRSTVQAMVATNQKTLRYTNLANLIATESSQTQW